ncbi:MAG TPA: ACP S-malonyltransferase, partial [Isosphaeraceae bacterium]|nr:ACP S-malonyltransferase [Isosphaeraceae bacterium]
MTVTNREEQPGGASTAIKRVSDLSLRAGIGASALAFRGYDQTNLGRSAELLRHRDYGPIVARTLVEASEICSDSIHRRVDLVECVRSEIPSSLDTFPEDVAMIVGMELAQVRILEEIFQVPVRQAKLSLGYSIGELSAVVVGGTVRLDQILPVPLSLATDCASLALDTTMGVLFTRREPLQAEAVERLCEVVRGEGEGLIGPSAYLSPNTALILGQGRTLDLLERAMGDFLPEKTMLRRKEHRWPPLHSPLVWAHNIPNRAAMAMYRIGGSLPRPVPSVISCVTGEASYDGHNCRETLIHWTDRPQKLWDVIDGTLSAGVETVIHIGPSPNLI